MSLCLARLQKGWGRSLRDFRSTVCRQSSSTLNESVGALSDAWTSAHLLQCLVFLRFCSKTSSSSSLIAQSTHKLALRCIPLSPRSLSVEQPKAHLLPRHWSSSGVCRLSLSLLLRITARPSSSALSHHFPLPLHVTWLPPLSTWLRNLSRALILFRHRFTRHLERGQLAIAFCLRHFLFDSLDAAQSIRFD
jgi:hypothetical protein